MERPSATTTTAPRRHRHPRSTSTPRQTLPAHASNPEPVAATPTKCRPYHCRCNSIIALPIRGTRRQTDFIPLEPYFSGIHSYNLSSDTHTQAKASRTKSEQTGNRMSVIHPSELPSEHLWLAFASHSGLVGWRHQARGTTRTRRAQPPVSPSSKGLRCPVVQ